MSKPQKHFYDITATKMGLQIYQKSKGKIQKMLQNKREQLI